MFRTSEGAAAEGVRKAWVGIPVAEVLRPAQFCLGDENADRIGGATYGGEIMTLGKPDTVTFADFGPNIAQAKVSENLTSEERNKPGAMTKKKGTENLASADRGLTADLVFQGVAFEHFGSMTPPLGSFIASADASRGGKSTIISLLEPFDESISGTILLG
ncbi:hypothetical protein BO83DRAFT_412801 [Aspergillus eucalypticola CBS 122712]|uniref:Uncharacterized protein n=1 Tax=Aspergillus eucalypticola (strain CBS 122712 / IBT 29274) TaxID=1448314 RepID=A0A317UNF6_ASPEC|nr:uncharacterized protein BO83DRAFT_412801 [Aspergillus eucalypticola CBS 122712]PWY62082.1 hypothetical protein BO83DRAFT_412801 [Aspergillus eucalypticola CBS 122712]